jgi:biopolymer transport protein ExbD
MSWDPEIDWDAEDEAPLVRSRERTEDADMDITPMIDITFLLLIFFVVCSIADRQTSIELAKATHGKGVTERDSIIITVAGGGIDAAPVYLSDGVAGAPLAGDWDAQRDLIESAVSQAQSDAQKENVLIKADRHVAHRDVARVIKAASRVEGMKIHLAVLEDE